MIEEDVIQVDGGITINVNMSIKNVMYVNNPATCSLKMKKKLTSIIDDSVITCDEIIDAKETKNLQKNIVCKTKSAKSYFAFY